MVKFEKRYPFVPGAFEKIQCRINRVKSDTSKVKECTDIFFYLLSLFFSPVGYV